MAVQGLKKPATHLCQNVASKFYSHIHKLDSTPKLLSNLRTRYYTSGKSESSNGRQKLVILGSGWGSYSVLRNINKSHFDVIVVSPRNHFLFTPLLTSTTVGTLEFR